MAPVLSSWDVGQTLRSLWRDWVLYPWPSVWYQTTSWRLPSNTCDWSWTKWVTMTFWLNVSHPLVCWPQLLALIVPDVPVCISMLLKIWGMNIRLRTSCQEVQDDSSSAERLKSLIRAGTKSKTWNADESKSEDYSEIKRDYIILTVSLLLMLVWTEQQQQVKAATLQHSALWIWTLLFKSPSLSSIVFL